jgi:hypothetical protein
LYATRTARLLSANGVEARVEKCSELPVAVPHALS